MSTPSEGRQEVRDFLASRRAKIDPSDVGLPVGSRRRVPGLRREEVAMLAGVSTEWYSRLEKGHIGEVSEDVLEAVGRVLRLSEEEHTYLFDLARAARTRPRSTPRYRESPLEPSVQWLVDSITMSAAFVRNGRLDVLATNVLARALHAPMFASTTTTAGGRTNFARFHFLDPVAREFYVDWAAGAATNVALLRAEAGREPHDRALRELVGELSTHSDEFAALWARHDIQLRHHGTKRLRHPVVGSLELMYQGLALPTLPRAEHEMSLYTAQPGTPAQEQLQLLASWAATHEVHIAAPPS